MAENRTSVSLHVTLVSGNPLERARQWQDLIDKVIHVDHIMLALAFLICLWANQWAYISAPTALGIMGGTVLISGVIFYILRYLNYLLASTLEEMDK